MYHGITSPLSPSRSLRDDRPIIENYFRSLVNSYVRFDRAQRRSWKQKERNFLYAEPTTTYLSDAIIGLCLAFLTVT